MNACYSFIACILISLSTSLAQDNSTKTFIVRSAEDFEKVETAIQGSKFEMVRIEIESGIYFLDDTFQINRSHVEIVGQNNPTLRLEKNINKPVISVGTLIAHPTAAEAIENISITGLTVDGNKGAQQSEYHPDLPWIRNNGIDVRATTNLRIDQVNANNNRSGGLVISWACKDVLVSNSSFSDNFFDGIAYYDSDNIFTIDCQMVRNRSAGISLDNRLTNSYFANCVISENQDVGIFARNSIDLMFDHCDITQSNNWGVFMSHDKESHGVKNISFFQCSIEQNLGGIYLGSVNEAQSQNVSVYKTLFNSNGDRPDLETAGVPINNIPSESVREGKTMSASLLPDLSFETVAAFFTQRKSSVQQAFASIEASQQ